MKIQLEDKKYRDLQQEVDQLSAQLRKMEQSRQVYEAATKQLGSFLDLVSLQMNHSERLVDTNHHPHHQQSNAEALRQRVARSHSLAALSSSTGSSGRTEKRRVAHGRSKSSAAELRRPSHSGQNGRLVGQLDGDGGGGAGDQRHQDGRPVRAGKRGGKALRRIKTFLRREKKYVVVQEDGAGAQQRFRTRENFSEPTSAKIVGFHGLWSLKNS